MNAWTLDKALILSRLIVWVIFAAGLIKTAVPNRILRLYPYRVNVRAIMPFSTRWQRDIAAEHLEAYRRLRRWIFGGLAAILTVGLLQFAYFKFFFMKVHGFDLLAKNMALHTEYTALRPENGADKARAAAIVVDLQHALAKYQDYHFAEADGFEPFDYTIKANDVEFFKHSRDHRAAFSLGDPASLLYRPTAEGSYKLVAATYVEQKSASEDQLNKDVPLSVARWRREVNLCVPGRGTDAKLIDPTKFFSGGSIATKQACDAASGVFYPQFSGWTLQVRPWEQNLKLVWQQ